MKGRFLAFLYAGVLILSGCASQWALKTEPIEAGLQWPPYPNKAKVTQVMTLTGFDEAGTSFPTMLKTLVFGKGRNNIVQPVAVAAGKDGRLAIADAGSKCVHLYLPSEEQYENIYKANSKNSVHRSA
jgi:hypothetical protein